MPFETILKQRSAHLCLLSALAISACGDDVTPTDDDGAGTSSSSSSTPTTTDDSTTSTTDDSTTDDSTTGRADSSSGEDSTSSSGNGVTSTTDDPTTESSTSGESSSSSSSSSTGDEPMMVSCPYGELMSPDLVSVDTAGQDSEFTNSCGGGGAPDVSYTLTAPADGTYFFTATSPDGDVDPLVAVYDGTCGGPELACNEDIDATTSAARVAASISEGDTVTVVIDGFSLMGGAVDLEVEFFEGTCPDGDAGDTVPVTITGSTVDGDNTAFGSCGGNLANDDQYTFTAPEAGTYTVDTEGSDFDTILYVLDTCGGTEQACNDNAGIDTSRLNLDLTAGEEVVFVVDGFGMESGNYQLNIDLDSCPDGELSGPLPITVTGNTDFETNASSGSCLTGTANDVAYSFTAPEDGDYVFDTIGSDFDTALYAFPGEACSGVELGCDDDGAPDDFTSSVLELSLTAGETITLVLDGDFSSSGGDYELHVALPECSNGFQEFGEECDGTDFDGETCITQGLGAGPLSCTDACEIDVSGCGTCGTGTVEGSDQCDGVALGQQTCEDLGFDGGALDCDGSCGYDTTQCANGIIAVCSAPGATIDGTVTVTDTIVVPDMGTIADVDVFVDMTHTYMGDIDMFVSADDLSLQTDLAMDECFSPNDMFAFFNDEGSAAVGDDCQEPIAVEGNLTPVGDLSVFDGNEASGSWTLTVDDDASFADDGTLNEWCVYITLE